MVTWLLTHIKASATAAKPQPTTRTRRCQGSQRLTCFSIPRTQFTLVLWSCWTWCRAGQHSVVRKGNADSRRAQGTGTKSIINTHFKLRQCTTCFLVEPVASP